MGQPIPRCHVVAMPYPGRGHINPMLNLCHLLLRSAPDVVVSFIVTEEWLGFLTAGSTPPPPPNFSFQTIPNVVPSEIGRAKDFNGFFEATMTKLEAPVERLLDRLELPKPSVIIYDTYLCWVVGMGNRRNIPVASFYTMSATVFSIFHHFDLLVQNHHLSEHISDEEKNQIISYIPGVPPMRIADLPTPIHGKCREVLPRALEAIKLLANAQFLIFTTVYELEPQVLDYLKQKLALKIYALGLSIPHLEVDNSSPMKTEEYMNWLDSQPVGSVLYISQGSFLSVSNEQLDEIIAGVCASGVRFLWVARGDQAERIQEKGNGNGLVVPWCDQFKVLCHPSIGGFWSHCGWNSTKEGAYAGLPMLTFPIFWDQVTNSRLIVDEWKSGLRVKKDDESIVTAEEIARIVVRLMDPESEEAKERRKRAKEIREICINGRSFEDDMLAFIRDISG